MSGKHGSFVADSISLLKQTFSEWLSDKAPQLGAALAYYTVFSLAPLILLLLAVIGVVFRNDPAGAWSKLTEQMGYFLDKSRDPSDPRHRTDRCRAREEHTCHDHRDCFGLIRRE